MQEFLDKQNKQFIEWIESQWNFDFKCVRSDFEIQGSPERSISRDIIEEKNSELFFFEKFSKQKFQLRHDVAQKVGYLNNNGLSQALVYKKTEQDEYLPFYKGNCFQISKFLNTTGIKRPDYLASENIGKNFALFLIKLNKASSNIKSGIKSDLVVNHDPFFINEYVYKLFESMKKNNSAVHKRYLPFLKFLEKKFIYISDKFDFSFCHGDLHPLNVIWEHDEIKAVIDWEFTGFKPDIFDAANLVGCAGIENPNGFTMPMVTTFINTLKDAAIISDFGWSLFVEYIIALRFAWVSEWLRKRDWQMLELEFDYLNILVNNIDELKDFWGIKK